MTFVKICGLRSADHAQAAVAAGADLLGFIFAPARRQVSPAEVARFSQAIHSAKKPSQNLTLVGVFVDEAPERMRAVAKQCKLDAIQLSGNEPIAVARQLAGLQLIKAVRFNGAAGEQEWLHSNLPHVRLLVDAHVPGAYGGAGVAADWEAAAQLARRRPIILAGGLNPANVATAIARVRPWGVDVSSGVETDGIKDLEKIRAFAAAAQLAGRGQA